MNLFLRILFDEQGGTLSMTRKTANTLATAAGMNANMAEVEAVVNGGISSTNIEDAAITAAKLGTAAVETTKIKDANVTAAKLASDAVETAKILDANVTATKLASDAVETAKILDANVTTAKIADANITNDKLAGSIADSKLNTITTANKVSGSAVQLKASSGLADDSGLKVTNILGAWVAKSAETIYQASTDGFVIAVGNDGYAVVLYTDSNATPTTERAESAYHRVAATMPVRKNDYWKVTCSSAKYVWWIPLGL